jgi:putative membrane protein
MKILIRLFVNAFVILLLSYYMPGIEASGFYAAVIAALVLGIINLIIKPIILFFTMPLNILTLGLFTFIINGLLFWFTSTIVKGFDIDGFMPALYSAFILTVVGWIMHIILDKKQ